MIQFHGTRVIPESFECWRLLLRVQNTGRPGRFQSSARVVSYQGNSYPQDLITYPLAWNGAADTAHLKRNGVAELGLSQAAFLTIQGPTVDVGIIGWSDFDARECAMLNDITARWVIEVKVWRTGWRLFPKKFVVEVSRAAFPDIMRTSSEMGRVVQGENLTCHESSAKTL